MPYELFLALRHLRAHRRRRFARVTALIAVTGIAVGVAALIVALALSNGFRDEMQDKILRGTAHLTVVRSDGQPMSNYQDVARGIKELPGVTNATGTTYDGAVIIGPRSSAYAVLRGIDDEAAKTNLGIAGQIVTGSSVQLCESPGNEKKVPPIMLGNELAARTGLRVGDLAEIISAQPSLSSPAGTKINARVVGIFRSGLFEYDSTWIYLQLRTANVLSGGSHAASVISVEVENIYAVDQVATNVRQALGSSYSTIDWREANQPLFTALAFERRIGIIIIAIIILIGAFNITSTIILIVMERRREIAVLSTLGATAKSILGIFVVEGAIVGLIGAVAGLLLGGTTILLANRYHWISLPSDVYSISAIPLTMNFRDMGLAALVAFLLSVIATIYPARAAARIRPAEILRDAN